MTLLSTLCWSQSKKSLTISRTSTPPKIDGILNETIWQKADQAKDFVQFRPEMDVVEADSIKTIVKMAYDDNAIYVGAYLYDDPKDIMKQLTSRDNFGQSDFFGVIFNPNNDGQNDTEFFVFSSGTQADALQSPSNGEDFSWNAVWDSAVKIVSDGWIVEMKIPYRCLRFSNTNVQEWGLQFHRHFRRDRTQYTWNPIDPSKGNIGLYHGVLRGLENIDPPVRLSLYPFTSGLLNTIDGQTDTDINIGLDLKYGISENFTLDATLIPDFSQAGFDDVELNLGPFEQTFSEQRQFFTEGVDLFNKGNLFFSRRIGNGPSGDISLNDDEEYVHNPSTVKVLNALKISGRTKKGLGIGVFNAITEKTTATVKNNTDGSTRIETVEPLANYSILVIDKQFNQNSSVSLINTNVTRAGHFRDANVTGLLADISNKRNTYNIDGQLKMSRLNLTDGDQVGYNYLVSARKSHGNMRYGAYHVYADNKYDINDLGLIRRNNYSNYGAFASYRIFKPTKRLNRHSIAVELNHRYLAVPNVYTGTELELDYFAQTRKIFTYGFDFEMDMGNRYDYFEPRTEGRYFLYKNKTEVSAWISTNFNKRFAFNINLGTETYFDDSRDTRKYGINFSPRFRLNDHLLLRYSTEYVKADKDIGYTDKVDDAIIFGIRNQKEITNTLSADYSFNPFQSLSLKFRNYWSGVDYHNNLFVLADNGTLSREGVYTASGLENDPNINFNTWNLDFSYSWQFAPGSFITALYRNRLFYENDDSDKGFSESLNLLLDQPIQHTFSLRIQYFIDYNEVKKLFKNKNNS